jgi:hypothetical protein
MPRTPGAKNRTPRELEAEGKHLIKQAKLKKEIEELKKKRATSK